MEDITLLLQSGGRDSTVAAVSLLESGETLVGVTLSANATEQIDLPKKRAEELGQKYKNYSWAMVDFGEWDRGFKSSITSQLSEVLPKSCLLCALSKLTAMIPFCKKNNIRKIAMGYTEYQSSWAEQTPLAINLQKEFLNSHGIELILPSQKYDSKMEVKDELAVRNLSTNSLENPCCISAWGTQDVSEQLIDEVVKLSANYFSVNIPKICFVDTLGEGIDNYVS